MTTGDYTYDSYSKFYYNSPYSPCPNCGYCPHCGRGGYYTHPWPWTQPTITWQNSNNSGSNTVEIKETF